MDLHKEIMNIPVEKNRVECAMQDTLFTVKNGDIKEIIRVAYSIGHRDARHDAAYLVMQYPGG